MLSQQPDHGQSYSGMVLGSAYVRHLINKPGDRIPRFRVGGGPAGPPLDIFDIGDRLVQVVAHVVTESAFRTAPVSPNGRGINPRPNFSHITRSNLCWNVKPYVPAWVPCRPWSEPQQRNHPDWLLRLDLHDPVSNSEMEPYALITSEKNFRITIGNATLVGGSHGRFVFWNAQCRSGPDDTTRHQSGCAIGCGCARPAGRFFDRLRLSRYATSG